MCQVFHNVVPVVSYRLDGKASDIRQVPSPPYYPDSRTTPACLACLLASG